MDHISWIIWVVLDISYRLDRIGLIVSAVLSGSYCLDRIGIGLGFARRNWILCAGWFATG